MSLVSCFLQIEEDECGDSFDIHISVSDPEKIGEYTLIVLEYPAAVAVCHGQSKPTFPTSPWFLLVLSLRSLNIIDMPEVIFCISFSLSELM